jgi:hypothetical protein
MSDSKDAKEGQGDGDERFRAALRPRTPIGGKPERKVRVVQRHLDAVRVRKAKRMAVTRGHDIVIVFPCARVVFAIVGSGSDCELPHVLARVLFAGHSVSPQRADRTGVVGAGSACGRWPPARAPAPRDTGPYGALAQGYAASERSSMSLWKIAGSSAPVGMKKRTA